MCQLEISLPLVSNQAGSHSGQKTLETTLQAKLIDPMAFMQLTEQVIGWWIDCAAQAEGILKWKDSVLAEVEKGNALEGQSTQTGILMSLSIWLPY
jgi:hypothetical protein